MEDWLLFAFLAPLVWACVNIIGKFLVDKHLTNPYVLNAYVNITFFALTVPVALFFGLMFEPYYVVIALIGGVLGFGANLLFTMSLKVEEASRVVPLSFLYPAFTALFAFLLLGETVGPLRYVGAALLILGSVLVSLRGGFKGIIISPALKFMIVENVLLGLVVISEKFTLSGMSTYSTLFWVNLGLALASAVSILISRQNRADSVTALAASKRICGLVWLDGAFTVIAVLFFYAALAVGPATLVSAINATQPFYALVIVILLSYFMPRILKEEHTKGTLFLKLLAIAAVFLGTYLIAM